jgi:hypothetical protein
VLVPVARRFQETRVKRADTRLCLTQGKIPSSTIPQTIPRRHYHRFLWIKKVMVKYLLKAHVCYHVLYLVLLFDWLKSTFSIMTVQRRWFCPFCQPRCTNKEQEKLLKSVGTRLTACQPNILQKTLVGHTWLVANVMIPLLKVMVKSLDKFFGTAHKTDQLYLVLWS